MRSSNLLLVGLCMFFGYTPVAADLPPFAWDTVQSLSYTFCFNASGPFSKKALAAIGKTKMMIHGLNTMQELDPPFRNSEQKVIAAAKQLSQAQPDIQNFYTIQNDFARSIYQSGQYFDEHPECALRDKNNDLVNITFNGKDANEMCHNGEGSSKFCYVYGFQTECGREAWLKYVVDTVEAGNLKGVFIDGFQGCDPYSGDASAQHNPCPRTLANCSVPQQQAWITGMNDTLWELRRRLGKNRTIICNRTGAMYKCGGSKTCFCDGANKERFYGGENDLKQVVANSQSFDGQYSGIIHVPHISDGRQVFNKSLAGFLASAGNHTGYGVGFGYDCDTGGWLRSFPELTKALGQPTSPAKEVNGIFTRTFTSGTRVFYNTTGRPSLMKTCIFWSDGTTTSTFEGCKYASSWLAW